MFNIFMLAVDLSVVGASLWKKLRHQPGNLKTAGELGHLRRRHLASFTHAVIDGGEN